MDEGRSARGVRGIKRWKWMPRKVTMRFIFEVQLSESARGGYYLWNTRWSFATECSSVISRYRVSSVWHYWSYFTTLFSNFCAGRLFSQSMSISQSKTYKYKTEKLVNTSSHRMGEQAKRMFGRHAVSPNSKQRGKCLTRWWRLDISPLRLWDPTQIYVRQYYVNQILRNPCRSSK
jgi:hypothetical protein